MSTTYVVLDTNILVSALLTPTGNPAKVYKMFLTQVLTLVYSEKILDEYKDVLFRAKLRIPADEANLIIIAIQQYGKLVNPDLSSIYMVDEDDRIFYDAAISAGAHLITGNVRHFPSESFILTPSEFLSNIP